MAEVSRRYTDDVPEQVEARLRRLCLALPDAAQSTDDPADAEMRVEGVPLARLLEEYAAPCERSDEIIAAHSLDDVGRHPEDESARTSLRWTIIHMIEETARHVGHLDIIREQLDGAVGYY